MTKYSGRPAGRQLKAVPLLCVLAVLVAGCATESGESMADLNARWDAQNVYPQEYKRDLLAYLRTYLNDPTGVRSAEATVPGLRKIGPGDRYSVCVRYNARNSDGKYVGAKEGVAVFVAGRLESFIDVPVRVRDICKEAAYAAFPELEKLTR